MNNSTAIGSHVPLTNSGAFCLDSRYSTTRTLFETKPVINDTYESKIDRKLSIGGDERRCEGGLRVKGFFKHSCENMPLISIVTIVYNGANHLEQTIQSVLGQLYGNVEYIVVDGGSTDGTLEIIKKYEDQIDYWVSESDYGISDAFNKGLSLTSGLWVGLINADDWFEPGAVEIVLSNDSYDVVYGNMQYWSDNIKDYVCLSSHENMYRTMSLNHPSVFVKRKAYQNFGGFDMRFRVAMDYELLLRFLVNGAAFKGVDKIVSNFRGGGVSGHGAIEGFREVMRAKEIHGIKGRRRFYFFKSCIKFKCSQSARDIGVPVLVSLYRKLFSPAKKSCK